MRYDVGTLYDICIQKAKESPCQKRGFGCVLMMNGSVIATTNNHPLQCSAHLCDPECIRFKIDSGTDSMIGACGHAEEHAIWEAIRQKGTAKGALLYVAGVQKPNNEPLIKTEPYFYCIRCATLMNYAEIDGTHMWFNNAWVFLTAKEAYKSSLEFALKEKKA